MKYLFFRLMKVAACIVLALQLSCCGDRLASEYTLEFPQVPEAWVSLLGEPCWKVEWLAPDGQKQSKNLSAGQSMEVTLPSTWANPVTAWPFWPRHNLIPGYFKPAGALFPFDVSGDVLHLSWEGGVDSVFYWELAFANSQTASKIPANFDWPRFRELFEADTLSEAVRLDPWLVDWRYVAEKTIESSFDRRRLVPQATVPMSIPVPAGCWYGTSPFAQPLFFAENELPVFSVCSGINVWVSGHGVLRVSGKAWVFTKTKEAL